MRPIAKHDLIMSVIYIGNTLHAYIENDIIVLHCSYFDTSVECTCWILSSNMCSV